jgi:hypothetical protein
MIYKMAKIIISIYLLAHWLACLFWIIGLHELNKYGDTWIKRQDLD